MKQSAFAVDDQNKGVVTTEIEGEVVSEDFGNYAQVHHTAGDGEAGFDLTSFGSKNRFLAVLAELELPTEPEVVVGSEFSDGTQRQEYVWANDRLLVVIGADPRTGEHGNETIADKDPGYASAIGIEGHPPEVKSAFEEIKTKATRVKGWNRTEREFL